MPAVPETQRITVRVPVRDVEFMDALVEAGEFTSRTAIVRRAVRDFITDQGPQVRKTAESQQALTAALEELHRMQHQLEAQREILEEHLER